MMKTFFDANVIIASCIEEHEHHERALELLERVLGEEDKGSTSAHALAEAYAVMTRLTVPGAGPIQSSSLFPTTSPHPMIHESTHPPRLPDPALPLSINKSHFKLMEAIEAMECLHLSCVPGYSAGQVKKRLIRGQAAGC